MSQSDLLNQLATHYGILSYYHDIWGNTHPLQDSTKRDILAAMGLSLQTDADIAAAHPQIATTHWQQILPAAHVVRGTCTDTEVSLRLHCDQLTTTLNYLLTTESGGTFGGSINPATLEITNRHQQFVQLRWHLSIPKFYGYHRLVLHVTKPIQRTAQCTLIVAPPHCYTPPSIHDQQRLYGLAAQLYTVRSEHNWGIGDLTDLCRIIDTATLFGASIVGLNPLHALYWFHPNHASPYSPSSRTYFNPMYLDVVAIEDFASCRAATDVVSTSAFQKRLANQRQEPQVAYTDVFLAKSEILKIIFRHFWQTQWQQQTERARSFQSYISNGGASLYYHCLFEAISEHFFEQDGTHGGFASWPAEFRDPASAAVTQFAQQHTERVHYFMYLQWQTEQQLHRAHQYAKQHQLPIGLYQDLAVGSDGGGADVWANQNLYALKMSVGAPPDQLNPKGQNWGFPPWIPHQLTAAAYQPFIETLRANMRYAGALRIDHVMGLCRLFWIPHGKDGTAGAYVRYPFDDLLAIVALESHRQKCMVIGEDLGTVPDEVRHALSQNLIFSYKVFQFERGNYPAHAVVTASTHDLPPLAAFWSGYDLEVRKQINLFPPDSGYEQQRALRTEDKKQITQMLDYAENDAALTPQLNGAIHRYLARSAAQLLMVQIEDALLQRDQINVPGTVLPTYPNWRYKMTADLNQLADNTDVISLFASISAERPPPHCNPSRPPRAQPLCSLTTLEIGGTAHNFFDIETSRDLLTALRDARVQKHPLIILGGGSNVVINDDDIANPILHIATRGIRYTRVTDTSVELWVAAGECWDDFVAHCVNNELGGIECLSGIPGQVGSTPIQNVGAYGQDVSQTIFAVKTYDLKNETFVDLSAKQCLFDYRNSLFKGAAANRFVVVEVGFRLNRHRFSRPTYDELIRELDTSLLPLSVASIRDTVLKIRRRKSMVIDATDPHSRSAGSFFTNPIVDEKRYSEFATRHPAAPVFATHNKQYKLSAAWLIEHAGLQRGFRQGPVGLSAHHALAIVNYGGATAQDIIALAQQIQQTVFETFNIWLVPEPVFLGFATPPLALHAPTVLSSAHND